MERRIMKSGSKVYAAGGNGENGSNRTGAGRKLSSMVVTPQAWQKHPKALPNDAKSLANLVDACSRYEDQFQKMRQQWRRKEYKFPQGPNRTSTASAATKLGRSPANSTGLTMSSITAVQRDAARQENQLEKAEKESPALTKRVKQVSQLRKILQAMIKWRWFDLFIMICIIANTVLLSVENANSTGAVEKALDLTFLTIFSIEMVIKLVALSPRGYVKSSWNLLDALAVLGSIGSEIVSIGNDQNDAFTALRTIRCLRILRSVRLVRFVPALRRMMSSIHNAATMLLDIGGLVCFLFVVYGLLGVQMFGPMDVGECAFPKNLSRDESLAGSIAQPVSSCFRADEACGSRTLNISGVDARHENMELQCRLLTTAETGTIQFDHLGWALLSLLQIATTDGWWQPFTRFRQYSDVGASLYWTTFIVAACFCVLQMITAIVVQAFLATAQRKESAGKILERVMKVRRVSSESAKVHAQRTGRTLWRSAKLRMSVRASVSEINRRVRIKRAMEKLNQKFRIRAMHHVLNSDWMKAFSFFNTLVMIVVLSLPTYSPYECSALEHETNTCAGMSKEKTVVLHTLDWVVAGFFCLEVVIRLLGMGALHFWASKSSVLDLIVALITLIPLVMEYVCPSCRVAVGRTILSTLRYFRAGKVAVMLGFFLVIMSVLSKSLLFSSPMFASFFQSFETLFFLLVPLNVMQVITAVLQTNNAGWGILFTAVSWIFGGKVIISCFTALIVEVFRVDDDQKEAIQEQNHRHLLETAKNILSKSNKNFRQDKKNNNDASNVEKSMNRIVSRSLSRQSPAFGNRQRERLSEKSIVDMLNNSVLQQGSLRRESSGSPSPGSSPELTWQRHENKSPKPFVLDSGQQQRKSRITKMKIVFLGRKVLLHPAYKTLFGLLSVVTVVLMLFEFPQPVAEVMQALRCSQIFICIFFFLDIVLITLCMDMKLSPRTEEERWTKRIHVALLVTSIYDLVPLSLQSSKWMTVLRVLRPFRVLRILGRYEGMQSVVAALSQGVGNILQVFVCLCIFVFLYAILGVSFFGGASWKCSERDLNIVNCQGLWVTEDSILSPRSWTPALAHFDNTFAGVRALVEAASLGGLALVLEGHEDVLHFKLFISIFIFIFSFFIMQLFTGVVVNAFSQGSPNALLTRPQRQWRRLESLIFREAKGRDEKLPSMGPMRNKITRLVTSKVFDKLVVGIIILNTLAMCLQYQGAPTELGTATSIIIEVCGAIYVFEAVLKIAATGWGYYLLDPWNRFDFLLVLIAGATRLMVVINGTDGGQGLGVLRLFRLLRLFKLIRHAKALRILISALYNSITGMLQVLGVLLSGITIFALLGCSLLGRVKHQQHINSNCNFESTGMAFLTTFRMLTLDDWNRMMYDSVISYPYCTPGLQDWNDGGAPIGTMVPGHGDCGTGTVAIFYWTFGVILLAYAILSLFVAVLLDSLDSVLHMENCVVSLQHLRQIRQSWVKAGLSPTGTATFDEAVQLLERLGPPLILNTHRHRSFVIAHIRHRVKDRWAALGGPITMKMFERRGLKEYIRAEEENAASLVLQKWVSKRLKRESTPKYSRPDCP